MKIIVQNFCPNGTPPCPPSSGDKIPPILTEVKQGKTKVLLKMKTAASFINSDFYCENETNFDHIYKLATKDTS